MDLSGQWIDRVHARHPPMGVILDMDSSVSPTYCERENSVWNGQYGCTCYHPLFVFNQFSDQFEMQSVELENIMFRHHLVRRVSACALVTICSTPYAAAQQDLPRIDMGGRQTGGSRAAPYP